MHETTDDSLLEKVHTEMVSEFSKTLEMFDLSTSEARLFATLYLNKAPMTLDEMGYALGKSKTSMSTGIRSLLDANLVERVWKKGERKDYYQAKENLYQKMVKSYMKKWIDSVDRQRQTLKEIEAKLTYNANNDARNKDIAFLKKRVEDIIEFHRLVESTFKL